jgi:K+-sensing histidine kinase KdpD
MGEVEIAMPGSRFELESQESAHLLGDERLLVQGIWSTLRYAAMIAEAGVPIGLRIVRSGSRVLLEVKVLAPNVSADEVERAFAPFASVQYEGDGGIRSAVGLFLARQIARLHGGTLSAKNASETEQMLVMDLPG